MSHKLPLTPAIPRDPEILLADGDLDLEELGLAMEEDEDRPDGAVMTTLKNLAKRARQGVTEDNPDEMGNIQ